MSRVATEQEVLERRANILLAARWCFLNFGYQKTALNDIAKRANLSRTLLYRTFKDKEEIYQAVFVDWLVSKQPVAMQIATGRGSADERLYRICQLFALEPWCEMAQTPMGSEFMSTCELINPTGEALYRKSVQECVVLILEDEASAEVFLLALDGLFLDQPSVDVLEARTQLLVSRFAPRAAKKGLVS